MARSNYEKEMEHLRSRYLDKNGDIVSYNSNEWIIGKIVKELDKYSIDIEFFERYYSTDPSQYVTKMRNEYARKKVPIEAQKSSKELRKEWEQESNRVGYKFLLTIPSFIKEIINIVNKINQKNNNAVISDALEVISAHSTGISKIDFENKKLADLFLNAIDDEKKKFEKENSKNIEKDIEFIKTGLVFYKWRIRHGKPLKLPDYQPISEISKTSFKNIFDELRSMARTLTINIKHYEKEEKLTSYNDRIEKLKDIIDKFNNYDEKINKEYHDYNYYLKLKEKIQIEEIKKQIFEKIYSIKKVYEQIKEKSEKYKRVIAEIDAIRARKEAIDEVIKVLNSNIVNSFPKALHVLSEARDKCEEYLKKNMEIIQLFDFLFKEIDKETNEVDYLMSQFNSIIYDGVKRKEEEENRNIDAQNQMEELTEANDSVRRQMLIDQIKQEVIRQMFLEGYGPDLHDKGDHDHFSEDFHEFNEVFTKRLIMALNDRNIDYEGANLNNPLDIHSSEIGSSKMAKN